MSFIFKSTLTNVYHLGGHDNTSYGLPYYIYPLLLYLYSAPLCVRSLDTLHFWLLLSLLF